MLNEVLTAGCGGGAACGCLLLPLLKEVEQMSHLGTDYAKKTSTFILEYWSRGKLNYKALEVAEGWGKRRTKLVAALLPYDQCHPSCTSTVWGGFHACLCGCCQAWHCCKSALTEREKVLMGFLSKGKCFLQKRFCMVTASPAGAVQDEYFCLLNAFKTGKCGLTKM